MLHKESIFRALTTIPKYFDRTFQYNVGERQKEGFGVEYQNIKNPIIMVQAKLPSSIFSHLWGLSWDSGGKWFSQALSGRKCWRWMVQTCLQVCCLPWPIFNRRHSSYQVCLYLPLVPYLTSFIPKTPCNRERKKGSRGFIILSLQSVKVLFS